MSNDQSQPKEPTALLHITNSLNHYMYPNGLYRETFEFIQLAHDLLARRIKAQEYFVLCLSETIQCARSARR